MYYLDLEDLDCLLNLKYKSVPCKACQGRGFEYVDENGDIHQSRVGFEVTWFHGCMAQTCLGCNGLKVRVILDSGLQL